MNPNLTNIPQDLTSLPNWVEWRLEKNEDGDDTKMPYISGTSKHASSTNPSTWTSFDAVKEVTTDSTRGVGFVIGGEAIEKQLTGIDIDGCRDPETGVVAEWADRIVDAVNSYTEITPSGTGLRVWTIGEIPPGEGNVFNLDTKAGYGSKVKIETYSSRRYFTMTGDTYFEDPTEIVACDLSKLYQLFREIKAQYPPETKSASTSTQSQTGDVSQSVPIERTSATVITTKLSILMDGKIVSQKPFVIEDGGGRLEYPSQSEADMALCILLALAGKDAEGIDEEFRKSSLYRDKWDRLADNTIKKALELAARKDASGTTTATAQPESGQNATNTTNPTVKVFPFVVVDGDDFMLENIPPRKVLAYTNDRNERIFFAQSINQIFAWRGLGKTNLGLSLTSMFANGGTFLNWRAPERSRVLYVEGEMPESQFQERWKQIVNKTDRYARLLILDKQPEHRIAGFATQEGIARVELTLSTLEAEGFKVEVLFLDSISTLFNIEANDEKNWLVIQSWFLSLRSRGICIFFFHHAGKSGMSRSHSKSEDMLDVSIKLSEPRDREAGCLHALLHYDKTRGGLNISDSEIKMRSVHTDQCACKLKSGLIGCPGDKVEWSFGSAMDVDKEAAYRMFSQGLSVKETARELKKPLGTVKTWRTHWSVSKIGQASSQEGSGGSDGPVQPVSLELDPKELRRREKERVRLEEESRRADEDRRIIGNALGIIEENYNQGLPVNRNLLARLLALKPNSAVADRLLVPSTDSLEGFRPWNTIRGAANSINFLPAGRTEMPTAPAKPEKAAKMPRTDAA